MDCASSASSEKNSFIPQQKGIENRNTFSEKVGMVVAFPFSQLANAAKKVYEGFQFAAKKIGMNSAAARVGKFVNQRILNPMGVKSKGLIDCLQISKAVNALDKRIFTPLIENALKPSLRLGQKILGKVSSTFNTRVCKPTSHGLTKLYGPIKPGVQKVARTLNDWIFTPVFSIGGDFFHGVHRGTAIGKEATEQELRNSLPEKNRSDDYADKATIQSFLSNATNHKEFNAALALHLKKTHSLVIDKKWISDKEVSDSLSRMRFSNCSF